MPKGFFHQSTLVQKAPLSLIPACGKCGLLKFCKSPKMPVSGEGRRKILVIGEAPGKNEDDQNKQFVGETGKHLEKVLKRFDVDLRKDCWLTNALICRPADNRTPTDKEIDYCRPNVIKTIKELKPEIIVLLGGPAVKSVMPYVWREDDVGKIGTWAGFQIPSTQLNCWICPTYHPSYVKREEKNPVVQKYFEKHLKAVSRLHGCPWPDGPRDYESEVKRILDPREVVKYVKQYIEAGKPIGFDYETNMLKPDSKKAKIISCSISDGETTIAYPFYGQAIEATWALLRSDLGKIASNLKFEDRWTRKFLGKGVKNWIWDTMVAAHVIDTRRGITSIKFQAFVRLGTVPYDAHIKPFLASMDAGGINQAHNEVELDQLLKYNGLDSLYEILVAFQQMKELGYDA